MNDYGRRIVLDLSFEAALGEVSKALRAEGLHTISRCDVRHHFFQTISKDFRRYFLIQAWSPALAYEAFKTNLDAGVTLATTIAVYELADGETAVIASEPLAPASADLEWAHQEPQLEAIAEGASQQVARVLDRLTRSQPRGRRVGAAA
jgi:uncharacterized protein (DUF302 family)